MVKPNLTIILAICSLTLFISLRLSADIFQPAQQEIPFSFSVAEHRVNGPFPTLEPVLDLGSVENLVYTPLPNSHFNFGFTQNRVWLKVRVTNLSHSSQTRMLETGQRYMRPLIIYEQRRPGNLTRLFYNDQFQPFSMRPLPFRDLTLPLDFAAGESRTFFLYVGSGSELSLKLNIAQPVDVITRNFVEIAHTAFFCGVVFTLILLGWYKFHEYRDPVYLVFSVHLALMGLYFVHLDGFTFQYFWPDSPEFNAVCTRLLAHSNVILMLGMAMTLFRLNSLNTTLWRIGAASAGISLVCLLLITYIDPRISMQLGVVTVTVSGFVMMFASFLAWLRSVPGATYLIINWFLVSLVVTWVGLGVMGVFSSIEFSNAPLKLGGIIHGLLTYIALTTHSKRDPARSYDAAGNNLHN